MSRKPRTDAHRPQRSSNEWKPKLKWPNTSHPEVLRKTCIPETPDRATAAADARPCSGVGRLVNLVHIIARLQGWYIWPIYSFVSRLITHEPGCVMNSKEHKGKYLDRISASTQDVRVRPSTSILGFSLSRASSACASYWSKSIYKRRSNRKIKIVDTVNAIIKVSYPKIDGHLFECSASYVCLIFIFLS